MKIMPILASVVLVAVTAFSAVGDIVINVTNMRLREYPHYFSMTQTPGADDPVSLSVTGSPFPVTDVQGGFDQNTPFYPGTECRFVVTYQVDPFHTNFDSVYAIVPDLTIDNLLAGQEIELGEISGPPGPWQSPNLHDTVFLSLSNLRYLPTPEYFPMTGEHYNAIADLQLRIVDSTQTFPASDFNQDGVVSVQDIFDFLAAYFNGSTTADINNSGTVSVQDIFDFLADWFANQ